MKIPSLKFFRPSKYESYASVLLLPFSLRMLVLPVSYEETLVSMAASLLALLCSINACLDEMRMSRLEHALAKAWFCITLFVAIFVFIAAPGLSSSH